MPARCAALSYHIHDGDVCETGFAGITIMGVVAQCNVHVCQESNQGLAHCNTFLKKRYGFSFAGITVMGAVALRKLTDCQGSHNNIGVPVPVPVPVSHVGYAS